MKKSLQAKKGDFVKSKDYTRYKENVRRIRKAILAGRGRIK